MPTRARSLGASWVTSTHTNVPNNQSHTRTNTSENTWKKKQNVQMHSMYAVQPNQTQHSFQSNEHVTTKKGDDFQGRQTAKDDGTGTS